MGVDGIVVYILLFRNGSFLVEVRTTTTVQSNSTQFFSPNERAGGGGGVFDAGGLETFDYLTVIYKCFD